MTCYHGINGVDDKHFWRGVGLDWAEHCNYKLRKLCEDGVAIPEIVMKDMQQAAIKQEVKMEAMKMKIEDLGMDTSNIPILGMMDDDNDVDMDMDMDVDGIKQESSPSVPPLVAEPEPAVNNRRKRKKKSDKREMDATDSDED